MKLIALLVSLLIIATSVSSQEFGSEDRQLWVMVKTDEYFRNKVHLELIDEVTDLLESRGLGELDGHSSGQYQLDFNYYGVNDYDQARKAIEEYLAEHYSNLVFTISKDYDVPYENF